MLRSPASCKKPGLDVLDGATNSIPWQQVREFDTKALERPFADEFDVAGQMFAAAGASVNVGRHRVRMDDPDDGDARGAIIGEPRLDH
jgi:hypothetical protein